MKRNKISVICIILLAGSLLFLFYYHGIQPFYSEQATESYRRLYHTMENTAQASQIPESPDASSETIAIIDTNSTHLTMEPTKSPSPGKFDALREQNPDICGWLTIPETNIDYPVVSSTKENTEYYLTHHIDGSVDKNGSLFIDYRTELTDTSKALVINGHNMKSTGLMFHELTKYNELSFYQQSPTFTFDTIYGDGTWKIFSVFKTNNNANHGERLNYFRNEFDSDREFLDYIYELKLRSVYDCPVSMNEQDSILLLSTCTYEMDDMRLVIAARRLRDGETHAVNTDLATMKSMVLYPDAWYEQYGGMKPTVTSFTEAYEAGEINWYDGTVFK